MLDLRQSYDFARYLEAIGWKVEKNNNTFAFIKRVPLLGNLVKVQRPEKISEPMIKNLINKYKPYQIIVEPKKLSQIPLLTNLGFKQSKIYFVPTKTVQVDLSKSINQLLAEMHYKTRYNIKKSQKSVTTNHRSHDITSFASFWQKCAMDRGMFLSQKKEIIEIYNAFGKKAHIVEVLKDKVLLAAVLLICTDDIAYYMYAASTKIGKLEYAPTLAVWESIKLAKKNKCGMFDFEGIYDERFPLNSWKGFTRFKKSFGGKEIEYPGSFSKYRLPI